MVEIGIRWLLRLERVSRRLRLRLQRKRVGQAAEPNSEAPNNPIAWEALYLGSPSVVSRLSHPVAHALAELTVPGELLLEAGCGSAQISAELATAGRRIELCDFSAKILGQAKRVFEVSGLTAPRSTECDITDPLPWAAGEVDVVWSSGVLEHWSDEQVEGIVREMARVSRRCVISLVPYAGCVLYQLAKHTAERNGLWPYGRELPRWSLRPLFEKVGLKAVVERTIWSEAAPDMLNLTDPLYREVAADWWSAASADKRLRGEQGYLLLTVGYR